MSDEAPRSSAMVAGAGGSLLRKIWRRRTLFALVFSAVLAASLVALLVLPVRFMATGSIIVAEQEPGVQNASPGWAEKIGDPADLESQLLVIRSPRVLRAAMNAPGALDAVLKECRYRRAGVLSSLVPQFTNACDKLKPDSEALLDYLQAGYVVGAVGRSRVINISYLSPLPASAQLLANALINAFLGDQRASMSSGRQVAADWLWQELRQLDLDVRDEDAKIQAFRREKGLMRGATAPIASERLTSISQQLSVAEAARADAAAKLRELKAGQAAGTSDAPAVLGNRAVADLKQQIAVASAQLATAASTYGPNHPTLHALQQQLGQLQQRLSKEVGSVAGSLNKEYAAADTLANSLRQQMTQVKSEVATATADEASIENMVRNADVKRQQYADLYKRASELETERRVLQGSTRLVSLAELPTKPFFPKPLPFAAAGLVAALFAALAAVILRERADRSVRASADLVRATGISTITALPDLRLPGASVLRRLMPPRHHEAPLESVLKSSRADPKMQDALRKLYAELLLDEGGRKSRRILITSPGAKEGKTFTTLALAQFAAATGRRVLVIECDMRHPTIEGVLGLKRTAGLADLLRGTTQPWDAVLKTATPNLDVIVAGDPTVNSTELLMGHQMSELLLWAQGYELVLLDSPPANVLMDACVIAKRVGDVLCCMRWGHSAIADVVASTARLEAFGGKVLGLVITMVNGADQARYEDTFSEPSLYLKAS